MADIIRGHLFDSQGTELRDVNTVYVSGLSIPSDKGNYGLLVVLGNSDGKISSDNPLDTTDASYTSLDASNDLYDINTDILKELKKMNIYLSMLLDEEVKNEEIEV